MRSASAILVVVFAPVLALLAPPTLAQENVLRQPTPADPPADVAPGVSAQPGGEVAPWVPPPVDSQQPPAQAPAFQAPASQAAPPQTGPPQTGPPQAPTPQTAPAGEVQPQPAAPVAPLPEGTDADDAGPRIPTKEEIEQLQAKAAQSDLDEAVRTQINDLYKEALRAVTAATDHREAALRRRGNLEQRPENISKYSEMIKASTPLEMPPEGADTETLKQALVTIEGELSKHQSRLKDFEDRGNTRKSEIVSLPGQIDEAKKASAAAAQKIAGLSGANEPPDLVEARRVALSSQLAEQRSLAEAQELLLEINKTGGPLLDLQRQYFQQQVAMYEKGVEELRRRVNAQVEKEAAAQAKQATADAKRAEERPKPIAELAQANADLAARREELAKQINERTTELESLESRQQEITKQFENSVERFSDAAMTEAIVASLRSQRGRLPDPQEIRRSIAERSNELEELQEEQYVKAVERTDLEDTADEVETAVTVIVDLFKEANVALSPSQIERYRADIEQRLDKRQEYLLDIDKTYNDAVKQIQDLNSTEGLLADASADYSSWIADRVIWYQSAKQLFSNPRSVLRDARDALAWSLSPANWSIALDTFVAESLARPLPTFLVLIAFLFLLWSRRKARRTIRESGAVAAKRTCTEFLPTLRTAWHTIVLAAPFPLLMWFVSQRLDAPLVQSQFLISLSIALSFTAVTLFLFDVIRQVCRKGGLAEAHLDWPQSCLSQARSAMRWLSFLGLPLLLWVEGLEHQNRPEWSNSLGRVLFMALMLLMSLVLSRVFLSGASPLRRWIIGRSEPWLVPLHNVWIWTVVAGPALLAVGAAAGYYYTAQQLALRGLKTAALVVVLLILGGLLKRLLLVHQRRLAREQAKQRRAAAVAAAASAEEAPIVAAEAAEEAVDLASVSDQTRKLLQTLIFVVGVAFGGLIWAEIFSAFLFQLRDEIITGSDGPTWADVIVAGIALVLTWIVVRNLPGLLELVVLQRLPLDSGARYAVTTIFRYVLSAVGLSIVLTKVGFDWGKAQWLVAAMGVGLGFGLQEIFANFVSGIILLFERPIRVGDIITLGDKTGMVSKIRIRATTITDWDRKEYVVPNKDLVTERLLNWTLSDPTNRVVVNVGVAYGSDTEKAIELLRESALEQEHVLEDPAPVCTFEGFGDSTLNLVLRCYLPTLEHRLATIHALHTTIDRKFREASIEIAFPQRDLHIRSVPDALKIAGSAAATNGQATNGVHARDAEHSI